MYFKSPIFPINRSSLSHQLASYITQQQIKTLCASELSSSSTCQQPNKSWIPIDAWAVLITQLVGDAAEAASLAPCEGSCPMAPWGSCQQKSPRGPSCSRSPKTGTGSFKVKRKGGNIWISGFIFFSFLCFCFACGFIILWTNIFLASYLFVEFYTSNHS